jgi:predicted transcriptional regulator of viral defense system/very-short-patch-repair endonuclease
MAKSGSKAQIASQAGRQWGRVTWPQLKALGISDSTIADWLKQGYLHRRLPRVYAVGHPGTSTESDLAEALFYAGPGAMLSHATAAWWLGLLDYQPRKIHVSTPRRCRPLPGVVVHRRRALDRIWHRGLPTTTFPQTFLDVAVTETFRTVRRALAKADFADDLDVRAVEAVIRPGRPGGATLRKALAEHQPALAVTKSHLEILFLEICEQARFQLPEVNQHLAGVEIDAMWREQRIAVELDGHGNHHTRAQLRSDRRKELAVRTAGFTPVRYSGDQLEHSAKEVIADLRRLGAPRR